MKDATDFNQLASEYPYIYAWGKSMRSYDYYIHGQMELAKEEGAPKNATYRNHQKEKGGVWNTTDGMRAELLEELNEWIKSRKPVGKIIIKPL